MKGSKLHEGLRIVRIDYPEELELGCPVCHSIVKYMYPSAGKKVRMLDEVVYQVIKQFTCENPGCSLYEVIFNPSPRFDYGPCHFGSEVLDFIADEFLVLKQSVPDILKRIDYQHSLIISESTVRRMCDEVLLVKNWAIDSKTYSIIKAQGKILLGLDGQQPKRGSPVIWCFMDNISGRVLYSEQCEFIDYKILRDLIEKVKEIYDVPIVGLISDKQGLIVKCRDAFYPDIQHQYCQFHFLKNQWKHLSMFDGKVFITLKKAIQKQNIMKASRTATVNFQDRGYLSVRDVFAPVESDFKKMIKATNKTFKMLKGIWLYEALDEYITTIESDILEMDYSLRFTKISSNLASSLRAALNTVSKDYEDTVVMMDYFQQIRKAFGELELGEGEIDEIYEKIWNDINTKKPNLKKELLRTFMPKRIHTVIKAMGEWVRLWSSYRRGLFAYKNFTIPAKTNNLLEQTFSKQKYRLRKRGGKGNVYGLVSTQGELYLRLVCCSEEELNTDIKDDYFKANLYELKKNLDELKHAESARWWTGSEILLGWIATNREEY